MLKDTKIIIDFSMITFLYYSWAVSFGVNYDKLVEQQKIKLYPVALSQAEPFFGDWHYFDDLDMNHDRPHFNLIRLKNEICVDEYDFYEVNTRAFFTLLGFWEKGLTYITYLYKLYVHFNLHFSSIEFTLVDLYFSMLSSLDELILFLLENNELKSLKDNNLNKLYYLDKIVNHILIYPDFVNLFFAWSNYSLKYKDKWLDLIPKAKVKEVLLSELSFLSIDTICYLSLNLPWTLEQHKQDEAKFQDQLSKAFRPIFENMLKIQKGETGDLNIPVLTPINIDDLLKK